ncbi:hypothetical protein [Mucilaginibacter sp. L196]|uniref:hypothetical protein n=1 Tax=Mucilaginibacter sp. L196 TaxID=1641870 RepID=UPI00131E9734|nr:hypothetical protein [Mucilaginibacter sp. L196]
MKRVLLISGVSLLALGLIFGKLIGRYFMNKVDNPDTSVNNGQTYAARYIADCDTLQLVMKDFKDSTSTFKVKSTAGPFSDNDQTYVTQHKVVFYDSHYKKDFSVLYFFNKSNLDEDFRTYINLNVDSVEHIAGTVNKHEMADATYGDKQKPIPVLYFHSTTHNNTPYYDLTQQDKGSFIGSEGQFRIWMLHYNVWHYLSYVKSKADFERMFGKQTE